MGYQIYCISAGRSHKLPFNKKEKNKIIFLVKKGEKNFYLEAGCKNVIETGNLLNSRNYALEHSFKSNNICVQISDDLKKIELNKNFFKKKQLSIIDVIDDICKKFEKIKGCYLLGIPPTNNHFFCQKLVSKNTFCIGDLIFIKPNELRFDTNLTLKEDYDYTLQHIQKYKNVIRYQKYILTFQHYTNTGGAVDIRNKKEERKNIFYLMQKWGNKIKKNPKRENEILLNL